MKKPDPKNLKYNKTETERVRSAMAKKKSIKITINIDAETLAKIKTMAEESGIPYQRLLNRTLTESLEGKETIESRIETVEQELKDLKKQLAA